MKIYYVHPFDLLRTPIEVDTDKDFEKRIVNTCGIVDSDTMSLRSGSAQAQITINNVEPFEIMIPTKKVCMNFSQKVETLYQAVLIKKQEIEKLTELQSLLLAKMGQ